MNNQNTRILIRKNYVLGSGLNEYNGNKFVDFNNIFVDLTNNTDGKVVIWDRREIETYVEQMLTTISQGIRGEVLCQTQMEMDSYIAAYNYGQNITIHDQNGTSIYNKTNAVIGDRIQFRNLDNNLKRMYPELATIVGKGTNNTMVRTTYINDIIKNTNDLDIRIEDLEDNRVEMEEILVRDGSVKLNPNYQAIDNITDFNQITDWGSSVKYTNMITQGLNDSIQPVIETAQQDILGLARDRINKNGSIDMDDNYVPTRDKSVMTKIDMENAINGAINDNNNIKDPVIVYAFEGAFDYNSNKFDFARISQMADKQINLVDRQFTKVGNDTLTYTFQAGEDMSIFTSDKSIFAQLIWVKLPKPEELPLEDTFNNGQTTQNTYNGNPIDVEINTTTITITGLTTQDQTSLFNNFRIKRIFQFGNAGSSVDLVARNEITRVEGKFDGITTNLNNNKQNKAINLSGITATTVEGAFTELNTKIENADFKGALILNDKVYGRQREIWDALQLKFPYDSLNPTKDKGVLVSIVANASWSFLGMFNGYYSATTAGFVGIRVYNTNSTSPSLDMCSTVIDSTNASGMAIQLRKMNVLLPTSPENATPKSYVDDANAAQNIKIDQNKTDIAALETKVDSNKSILLPYYKSIGFYDAESKSIFNWIVNVANLTRGQTFIYNDALALPTHSTVDQLMCIITELTSTTATLNVQTIVPNNITTYNPTAYTIEIDSNSTTRMTSLEKKNLIYLRTKKEIIRTVDLNFNVPYQGSDIWFSSSIVSNIIENGTTYEPIAIEEVLPFKIKHINADYELRTTNEITIRKHFESPKATVYNIYSGSNGAMSTLAHSYYISGDMTVRFLSRYTTTNIAWFSTAKIRFREV